MALPLVDVAVSHADWQVVLVRPSQRKVVLFNPLSNTLTVSSHPSPTADHSFDPFDAVDRPRWNVERRVQRRRDEPDQVRVEAIDSDDDGDVVDPESPPPATPFGSTRSTSPGRRPRPTTTTTTTAEHRLAHEPPPLCPFCHSPLRRPASRPAPTARTRSKALPLPSPPRSSPDDPTRSGSPSEPETDEEDDARRTPDPRAGTASTSRVVARVPSYFQLLSEANSLANTPTPTGRTAASYDGRTGTDGRSADAADAARASHESPLNHSQLNEGYYAKFFEQVQLLGKGGQGSVYLVRHVLNGEALGLYACKKIPVGDSTHSLLRILREVHLLESLQHPNIVSYHHAWLETSVPTTPFVPSVPTLFVLMSFANGGSLRDFILARGGGRGGGGGGGGVADAVGPDVGAHENGGRATVDREAKDDDGREGIKESFRRRRQGKFHTGRAVHLLKVEDILALFKDIVIGLAFLHSKNILHLDLKAENVLLHWSEDSLLPTCKLSDFGNATDDSFHREREGGSGTLEYTPPEAWNVEKATGRLATPDRAMDMWALGLILHLLCFFTLPYHETEELTLLEREIRSYRGFHPSDIQSLDHGTRHDVPRSVLRLLSKLIHVDPSERPTCDKVLKALREIEDDLRREREAGEDERRGERRAARGGGLVRTTSSTREQPARATDLQVMAIEPDRRLSPETHSSPKPTTREQRRPLIRRKPSPPSPSILDLKAIPPRALPSSHDIANPPSPPRGSVDRFPASESAKGQAIAGLSSLIKLVSLSFHWTPRILDPRPISTIAASSSSMSSSSSSSSSSWLTYLILAETIFDVSVAQPRTTLALAVIHFAVLAASNQFWNPS
ncbi:hypothetical protein JCM10212_002337 [Sporobolomyces blumeae]